MRFFNTLENKQAFFFNIRGNHLLICLLKTFHRTARRRNWCKHILVHAVSSASVIKCLLSDKHDLYMAYSEHSMSKFLSGFISWEAERFLHTQQYGHVGSLNLFIEIHNILAARENINRALYRLNVCLFFTHVNTHCKM